MTDKQFKPAWWLPNSHLQTLWPMFRKPPKIEELERERFELPDGDFIDLDWLGKNKQGPLVILLHGFEGSIDSHYAKGMMMAIGQQNWRSVFMHFRGCSGEPNRLPRGYHVGETSDVNIVLHELRKREPDTDFAAVGYSLGGNILLKWLGETAEKNFLKAAIAVSVPFDLVDAADKFENGGFSQFYEWYLVKCARERLIAKHRHDKQLMIDLDQLARVKTVREFDNTYTAPVHGFSNADEYYSKSSSRNFLKHIQVPTLIVHAKDDPFMTEASIPSQKELSPKVTMELSETGGHVGFVSGKYPWQPDYWLEHRVPEFLSQYFGI